VIFRRREGGLDARIEGIKGLVFVEKEGEKREVKRRLRVRTLSTGQTNLRNRGAMVWAFWKNGDLRIQGKTLLHARRI